MIFQAFPISFTAQWYPLALVDLPKERHLFLLSQVSFLVLIYWLGLELTVNLLYPYCYRDPSQTPIK